MGDPPRLLDGAKVMCWAVSPEGAFYLLRGSDVPVTAMAVCQYEDGATYLFKCDSNWQVVQDWDCYGVEDGKEMAIPDAHGQPLQWCRFPE